jgi:uncharacterized protein YndB with AHSA1/START domain
VDANLIARASVTINATRADVWNALLNREAIKQYMFGADVVTDWQAGSPIFWRGEWKGKSYEDKGVVLCVEPERTLQYSHFSPLSGLADKPENYHTVTIELSGEANQTRVSLAQDKNLTEESRAHSEKNWGQMLAALQQLVEDRARRK